MMRLDVLLFQKKMFPSREKAKDAIMRGIVKVNGVTIWKAGYVVEEDVEISLTGEPIKYVSRAGLKLEKAKEYWNIDFNDKVVIDVGASTGGFTDFCLQNGAKYVYAVDVGTRQLHESLCDNPRVYNMQQTDFRTVNALSFSPEIAVCDVSFISLTKFAEAFRNMLEKDTKLIVLIKPQFECGPEIAKKCKGIIKYEKLHNKIVKNITDFYEAYDFKLIGTTPSPILGGDGNKEFLAYFVKR